VIVAVAAIGDEKRVRLLAKNPGIALTADGAGHAHAQPGVGGLRTADQALQQKQQL